MCLLKISKCWLKKVQKGLYFSFNFHKSHSDTPSYKCSKYHPTGVWENTVSSAVGSAFNQPSPRYEDCVMLDFCLLHALAWSVAGCLLLCSTFYKGNQWITSKPDCPENFQGFLGGEELFLFFYLPFSYFVLLKLLFFRSSSMILKTSSSTVITPDAQMFY